MGMGMAHAHAVPGFTPRAPRCGAILVLVFYERTELFYGHGMNR